MICSFIRNLLNISMHKVSFSHRSVENCQLCIVVYIHIIVDLISRLPHNLCVCSVSLSFLISIGIAFLLPNFVTFCFLFVASVKPCALWRCSRHPCAIFPVAPLACCVLCTTSSFIADRDHVIPAHACAHRALRNQV